MGSWGSDAKRLIREIGGRIAEKTGDSHSDSFLVQRMAIAIQRGNAASVLGTFAPETLRVVKYIVARDMPWKRPDSVPKGQVWSRFKGRELNGQPAKMYQIRDLDPKYEEQCLELMVETFLRDEPLCKVLDVKSDPVSVKSIRSNWEEYIAQGISLACFTEVDGQPDELVGFNVIVVKCRGDKEESFEHTEGEPWKKLVMTLDTAEKLVNVFDHYGVDKYLSSSGLTVQPGHRGQNIGSRMFAAREPLCKALGINAVCTVFTATTSQVLAAKCGYQVLDELKYEDMKKQGVDLTGCESDVAKVMGIKFDF